MHRYAFLVVLLAFLPGCAGVLPSVEDAGTRAFEAMESSSAIGLKAARRYEADIVRAGPLFDDLKTRKDLDQYLCRTGRTHLVEGC